MRILTIFFHLVRSRIYRPQVGYEFPTEALRRNRAAFLLPEGYDVRQPLQDGDEAIVAALLSQEPGYGVWTAERVRRELLARLAHPKAATLVLFEGIAGGRSWRRSSPSARSATAWMPDTGRCWPSPTRPDPTRLSASLLYLSNGARPSYGSLSCFWHWRKIYRRLGPALERSERLRASAEARSRGSAVPAAKLR